jgi:hypothetical protein
MRNIDRLLAALGTAALVRTATAVEGAAPGPDARLPMGEQRLLEETAQLTLA